MKRLFFIISIFGILLSSCKKDTSNPTIPPSDKPYVNILSPKDGQAIVDSILIQLQAGDDKGITKLELLINNDIIKEFIIPPFTFVWHTNTLQDGSAHQIFAKAYDGDGNVASSKVILVNVHHLSPSNLHVQTPNDTLAILNWQDNSSIEKGFEIEMQSGINPFNLIKVNGKNENSISINYNFSQDSLYLFRVRAFTDSSKSNYTNIDTLSIVLKEPTNLAFQVISFSSIQLSWKDNSSFEKGFRILRNTNAGNYTQVAIVNSNTTSYIDNGLDTASIYSYKVVVFTTPNYSESISMSIKFENFNFELHSTITDTHNLGNDGIIRISLHPLLNNIIITGGGQGWIEIWDYKLGQLITAWKLEGSVIRSVEFNHNGSQIISTNSDGVKLWEYPSGNLIRTMAASYTENAASFSKTDAYIVTGGQEKKIKVWDANNSNLMKTIDAHSQEVRTLVFSNNGNLLVSSSEDKSVKIWDSNNWSLIRTLAGHTGPVGTARFNEDDTYICSAADDNTTRVWSVSSGSEYKVFTQQNTRFYDVQFSPDNSILVSADNLGKISLWGTSGWKNYSVLQAHSGEAHSLCFDKTSSFLITGGSDSKIKIWQRKGSWYLLTP